MTLTLRRQWIAVAALLALTASVLPFRLAFAGAVQALAPVTEADAHLGFCDVLPGAPPGTGAAPWAQLAYNAGARVNRWEFRWDRVEPQNGQWNFGPDDADVAASRQYNLAIDGIIDGIPRWAVAPHQPPGNGVPRGLWRSPDDPRNLWASFLRGLVAHYRGEVGYWEIWNEPDLTFFWNGTPADYARLLRVASRVIRATDPNARVMVAGMVVPDLAFADQVFSDLHTHPSGGARWFDVAGWHAYGSAAALSTNILRLRALLARDGFGNTPIWVTEDGFPAANPQGEARQAAYILQTIAYAYAAGASHILIYRASDDTTPKAWGVMAADGTPRQGYVAFQIAARYLSHREALVYDPSSRLQRFVFYQPDRRVVLLWNRGQADTIFRLPAGHPTATLVDWLGQETPIGATTGAWKAIAPGASYNRGVDQRNAVVGGPPVLLLEDNTPPSNLPVSAYVPPVPGGHRQLVLVNPSEAMISAQVVVSQDPDMRQVVQVAPHAVARVDLDLLAGPGYGGGYALDATDDLPSVAASDAATTPDVHPSSDWYLAAAPASVVLSNMQSSAVTVELAAYGTWGGALGHEKATLAAGSSVTWRPPEHPGQYALTVHASSPIVLSDPDGVPLQSAAAPTTDWYALHPRNASLALFNPLNAAVHVSAQFVGAPTVKAEQLRLPPLHSFALATHGARAVTLEATGGLVAAYRSSEQAAAPQSGALTSAGLAAAGADTHVDLFDPSAQPAHVSLALVTPKGTTTITRTLKPQQVASIAARRSGGPPSGVLLNSDVPVVAATAP